MIKYRYAKTATSEIVKADSLRGVDIPENLECLGCGNELIARVNGQKVKPHFAHKVQLECNGETYLHKLAKETIYRLYTECLASGEPYYLELAFSKTCKKYSRLITKCDDLGVVEKRFDLTQYYQSIEMERKDGCFIPDLLLKSTKDDSEKIYIEIAVTHFLSEKKAQSNHKIIEIPIEEESDIESLNLKLFSQRNSFIQGFQQQTSAITDSECTCKKRNYYCFYIFDNGKCFLDHAPLEVIHSNYLKSQPRLVYSNLFESRSSRDEQFSPVENSYRGELFVKQLKIAKQSGHPVRNCFLCRYHGNNRDGFSNQGVFCKYKKKACNSNEAPNCEAFRYESA